MGSQMLQFKATSVSAEGEFSAVIYRVEGPRPDADGDVVLAGAIADGAPVVVSLFNHDTQLALAEPAGEATLRHEGDVVVAHGRTFDTTRGRQLRALLKEGGETQQWSIGFRVIRARAPTREESARWPGVRRVVEKWAPEEISPVTRGACGPACHTVGAKCAGDCECQRDAAIKELARLELTRFRIMRWEIEDQEREIAAAQRPKHWSAIAEDNEIPAWQVHPERRRAATAGITLALRALGADEAPALRWFRHDAPRDAGLGFAAKGGPIWLRDGQDLPGCAETAAHETAHHLGHEEAGAERVAALARDAFVAGRKLYPGDWRTWQNARHVRVGDVAVNADLKAWRRVDPLNWERL